jgi:hypothetical protein
MAMFPIVEDLDVFEHSVGQFEACLPLLAVKKFVLNARPERLRHGIAKRVTTDPTDDISPAARIRSVKVQDVN